MVIAVLTASGKCIYVPPAHEGWTVRGTKDILAPQLNVLSSQLELVLAETVLQNQWLLTEHVSEDAQLTAIIDFPPPIGSFTFDSSVDGYKPYEDNRVAKVRADFEGDGSVNISVYEEVGLPAHKPDHMSNERWWDLIFGRAGNTRSDYQTNYRGVLGGFGYHREFHIGVDLCEPLFGEISLEVTSIAGKLSPDGTEISLQINWEGGGLEWLPGNGRGVRLEANHYLEWITLRKTEDKLTKEQSEASITWSQASEQAEPSKPRKCEDASMRRRPVKCKDACVVS